MTQQQEKEKATITIISAIRNRMKLMSEKTCNEIKELITVHNISATDIIDMCTELNYKV
jgi:hypothetical protein